MHADERDEEDENGGARNWKQESEMQECLNCVAARVSTGAYVVLLGRTWIEAHVRVGPATAQKDQKQNGLSNASVTDSEYFPNGKTKDRLSARLNPTTHGMS